MFLRPFQPTRFLQSVYGTEPFRDYCTGRGIPFQQRPSGTFHREDARGWEAALARLPRERAAQVELELATVNEMSSADATAHLLEAAERGDLPPATVPAGEAVALWFLVHRPRLFREAFFHHEVEGVDRWHAGKATSGIRTGGADGGASLLAEGLRGFFGATAGARPFCAAEVHRLKGSICVLAQVGDRPQFLRTFTDRGESTTERLRPAVPVLFVYYPEDGTVLLASRLRSRERVAALLSLFGRTVLGCLVVPEDRAFDLDVLKRPFRPLPDALDMESARVKALHLRYPARLGRRQVRLHTLSTDEPAAIEQMLRAHVPEGDLEELRVVHAELQVRLRLNGGSKNVGVRLWQNRSNLGETPLGDRLRACLCRWGLSHAR